MQVVGQAILWKITVDTPLLPFPPHLGGVTDHICLGPMLLSYSIQAVNYYISGHRNIFLRSNKEEHYQHYQNYGETRTSTCRTDKH